MTWIQCDRDDCVWTDFGDGYVVYHRPSGKTHLMNESSARLLRELLQQPMDFASISAEFDSGQDGASTEEYLERLVSMLHRLEQFGLIERA